MPKNSNNKRIFIRILVITIVTLILIALKLCNIIDESWLWVLSPAWLPLVYHILWLCTVYEIKSKERFGRK